MGTDAALVAAGQDALRRYAWSEARDAFLQALAIAESPECFEGLAHANRWLNDEHGTLDAGERSFRLFQAAGDGASAARVAVWLAIDLLDFRGQTAVANGWLQRAHRLLDGLTPGAEHGLLPAVEAYVRLMVHNDPQGAIALADRALEIARDVGPADVEMTALAVKGLALVTSGEIAGGMSLLDSASTAALDEEIEDASVRSTILCALMDACDRVRDFERASQWSSRIRAAADRWGLPAVITVCRPHYAVVLTWSGEWEQAEAELTAAIGESMELRPPMAIEGVARLAQLRLRQGRLGDASALFAQIEHEPLAQLGRAELALASGDAATAGDLAKRYLRRIPAADRVERAVGLELLARAHLAAGELLQAGEAARELRSIADAVATAPLLAAASFVEGALASRDQDMERARTALEDAVDLYARAGAPFEASLARVELGSLLAARGSDEPAVREWRAAHAAFEAIGAAGEAARVAALLAAAAGEGSANSTERALQSLRLSEREVEVLRLIAGGNSNREIAGELVLSVRTVERHISNIYAKLGANGKTARAAATAQAFRLGLVPLSR
jgi:ATP/maltotriose-dependent transcriptional regulator MalT